MSPRRLLAAAVLAAALVGPAAAHAATTPVYGALTPVGCVVDADASAQGCTKAPGLRNAAFLANSPDGRFVYVSSRTSTTVTTFARDRSTGKLTRKSCVSSERMAAELKCTPVVSLLLPSGLAVSPDGKSLYVASSNGNSLLAFKRNVATGKLTELGCFTTGTLGDPKCGQVPRLSAPIGVAVTPDGRSVYVTSYDGGVLNFGRAADGRLTFVSCVQSVGFDGCAEARGLSFPRWIAIAPDGLHLYVAESTGNAVVAFSRDPATGVLAQIGCWSGLLDGRGKSGSCSPARGMNYSEYVTISPDGLHVYASGNANSIAIFRRDPATGLLVQPDGVDGCVTDDVAPGDDCQTANGLATTFGLAFDPTGLNLYSGAYGSGSVGMFDRDPASGLLTRHGPCYSDSDPVCIQRKPLAHAGHLVVSPDARNVYVAAPDGDSVQIFGRSAAAAVPDLRARSIKVRKGKGSLSLTCPKDAVLGCYGSLRVRALGADGRPKGKGLTLPFDVAARKIAKLKLKLDATTRAALAEPTPSFLYVEITSRSPSESITYPRWVKVRGAG